MALPVVSALSLTVLLTMLMGTSRCCKRDSDSKLRALRFSSASEAEKAVQNLDGLDIAGMRIKVRQQGGGDRAVSIPEC